MPRATRTVIAALLVLLVATTPIAAAAGTAGVATAADRTPGGSGPAASAASTVAQADCAFPVGGEDATGERVTVPAEPERVVVLGPSAAQTTWDIGARDKVVGAPVDQYTAYLDGIDDTTDVGADGQTYVDNERVVNLTPDLVLAPNVIPDSTVASLRDANLTVYKFRAATTVEDVSDKTLLTGRLVGECDGAEETVAWMQSEIDTVETAVDGEDRPSVLFSMGGGWTAGSGTFVDHMISVSGGDNVASDANVTGYGQLSSEVVVSANPEWIVENGPAGAYPRTDAYNSTVAVQQDQVFAVNPNYVSQPGPRIVHPIVTMAKAFHPEAYAAANTTTTTTDTPDTTTTDASESTTDATDTTESVAADPTDTTTTDGQPGFTAVAAALALLAAALVARRE